MFSAIFGDVVQEIVVVQVDLMRTDVMRARGSIRQAWLGAPARDGGGWRY